MVQMEIGHEVDVHCHGIGQAVGGYRQGTGHGLRVNTSGNKKGEGVYRREDGVEYMCSCGVSGYVTGLVRASRRLLISVRNSLMH